MADDRAEAPTLESLLAAHTRAIEHQLAEHARGLLRFEALEDLRQGVVLRALQQRPEFLYRSEREFLSWLQVLTERHIADRHDYWSALKRDATRTVRFTLRDGEQRDLIAAALLGRASGGPATFAARRELMVLAVRALASLPPRDQQLVRFFAEGVPLEDQARRLELGYAAVQRAGLRSLERLRKAFALIAGSSAG